MPLARLAQYQHCLLRRNGLSTSWSASPYAISAKLAFEQLKQKNWHRMFDT
jgi:hypothetical protein